MDLRFATRRVESDDPLSVLEAGSYRCSWCGFAAMAGMRAYVDDDGDRVACSVCDAARHAGIEDRARFRLAWIPEISQPQLAHLCRAVAYAKTLLVDWKASKDWQATVEAGGAPVKVIDRRLFAELVARADALDVTCKANLDVEPARALELLPADVRGAFAIGLRVLPVAFPETEIRSWIDDESSFTGLGLDRLDDLRWFVPAVGLATVGIGTEFHVERVA